MKTDLLTIADSEHMVRPRLTEAKWVNSCDTCRHQEGRHYCLMHSITMKNMDTIRCADHQDRGRWALPNDSSSATAGGKP